MSGGDGQDGEQQPHEPIGSVAEEAAKLFGAFSDLAREQGGGLGAGFSGFAGHAAESLRNVDEHIATGAEECRYCPLCRGVHAVRSTTPEVRAHLATAATSLVQAVAGLLATAVPTDRAGERTSPVEHIDLDDDGGDWPEDER